MKFKLEEGTKVAGFKVYKKHNPRAENSHWDTEGNLYWKTMKRMSKKRIAEIRRVIDFFESIRVG